VGLSRVLSISRIVDGLILIRLVGIGWLGYSLLQSGLYRKYRVFFAYLVFFICRSPVLLLLGRRSPVYAKVWMVTEPILWLFYILLVLELYSLVLANHKGLYTMGRWTLHLAVGVSLLVSSLIYIPASGERYNNSFFLSFIVQTERGMFFSLILFLVLIVFLLSRYPIKLSRNVIIHSIVYSVFFLTNTIGSLFLSMLGGNIVSVVNLGTTICSTACVAIWLLFLSAQGEQVEMTTQAVWGHGDEERLIAQLDTLNAILLKATRTEASRAVR
jgi:hypothetical protein